MKQTWVLPIEIDTINALVDDELIAHHVSIRQLYAKQVRRKPTYRGHVICEPLPLFSGHSLSENWKRVVLGRERPASEGQDSLHPFQGLKIVKHVLEVTQLDFKILADTSEGKVLRFCESAKSIPCCLGESKTYDVCVVVSVDLARLRDGRVSERRREAECLAHTSI